MNNPLADDSQILCAFGSDGLARCHEVSGHVTLNNKGFWIEVRGVLRNFVDGRQRQQNIAVRIEGLEVMERPTGFPMRQLISVIDDEDFASFYDGIHSSLFYLNLYFRWYDNHGLRIGLSGHDADSFEDCDNALPTVFAECTCSVAGDGLDQFLRLKDTPGQFFVGK